MLLERSASVLGTVGKPWLLVVWLISIESSVVWATAEVAASLSTSPTSYGRCCIRRSARGTFAARIYSWVRTGRVRTFHSILGNPRAGTWRLLGGLGPTVVVRVPWVAWSAYPARG